MKSPGKPTSRKRGAGILTVLTASTLLLLLGLTVAGTSFHHLSVSNRLHHSQIARNLAEDCLAKGLAKVLAHSPPDAAQPFSGYLSLPQTNSPADERGVLTFDPAELSSLNAKLKNPQLVASFNNIGGESSAPVPGTSLTIPQHSLYLRAVGCDHGIEKAMEAVLWVPPFPYSMAAGGNITISGDSKVASVKDLADLGDITKYLPGSLATNSSDPLQSLTTNGPDVLITGDVQSSGGVTLSAGTTVKGETRLHAGQVHIPTIDVNSYDTSGKPGVTTFSSSSGPNTVSGYAYRDGALNFNSGLTLNGGVIYVKGDLTVNGPISGEGALIATGKLTITGSGQLDSNNHVAFLAKDDLTLTGTSSAHLGASGLLYTEGKLNADYADISGSAAAPVKDINFNNVNMIQEKTLQNVTITTGGGQTPINYPPPNADFAGQILNIPADPGPPARAAVSLDMSSVDFQLKMSAPLSRWEDPVTHEYHMATDYQTTQGGLSWARALVSAGPPPTFNRRPPGVYETITDASGTYQVPPTSSVPPINLNDIRIVYNGTEYSGTDSAPVDAARQEVVDSLVAAQGGQPLTAYQQSIVDGYMSTRLTQSSLLDGLAAQPGNRQKFASISSSNFASHTLTASLPPAETVTFTLNPAVSNASFINLSDRIRVLYWREVPQ